MKIKLLLSVFIIMLCGCRYEQDVKTYKLINFDFTDNKVFIRGISISTPTDTFENGYEIIEKKLSHIEYPKDTRYRMRIFQEFSKYDTTINYTDTFYIEISRRKGDYFDWGKVYWFKLDSRYTTVIDSFKNVKCLGSYYCYYLTDM